MMNNKQVLVTGSSGHLGEALVRVLMDRGHDVGGIDINKSDFTRNVGSITDRDMVSECMQGVDTVFHTATLHKPHIATHTVQDFIDTNITGTLILLEEAVKAGVQRFIFTSTTSVFGDVLTPKPGEPAAWITEDIAPIPKNIYGVTKQAAENLCKLFHKDHGLPVIILRTSRFFPEDDDDKGKRNTFNTENLKANEYLYRRVEIQDVVEAHLLAADRAAEIGFGTYIISATSPFVKDDLMQLRTDPNAVINKYTLGFEQTYARYNWQMLGDVDRVYINQKAREELGWKPLYDFAYVIDLLNSGKEIQSPLAKQIGAKGYHKEKFTEGPYPVK